MLCVIVILFTTVLDESPHSLFILFISTATQYDKLMGNYYLYFVFFACKQSFYDSSNKNRKAEITKRVKNL